MFAKNYFAVHFKLDYVNADGNISNYYPDFLVKLSQTKIVIVETKGLEDLDVPLKMARLRQWCEDVNQIQSDVKYDFVYIDQESFDKFKPKRFRDLMTGFREYKSVFDSSAVKGNSAQSEREAIQAAFNEINVRRHELIKKRLQDGIGQEEAAELDKLQEKARIFADQLAPIDTSKTDALEPIVSRLGEP